MKDGFSPWNQNDNKKSFNKLKNNKLMIDEN